MQFGVHPIAVCAGTKPVSVTVDVSNVAEQVGAQTIALSCDLTVPVPVPVVVTVTVVVPVPPSDDNEGLELPTVITVSDPSCEPPLVGSKSTSIVHVPVGAIGVVVVQEPDDFLTNPAPVTAMLMIVTAAPPLFVTRIDFVLFDEATAALPNPTGDTMSSAPGVSPVPVSLMVVIATPSPITTMSMNVPTSCGTNVIVSLQPAPGASAALHVPSSTS